MKDLSSTESLNIRLVVQHVRESISKFLEDFVFEPNSIDVSTILIIESTIKRYLSSLKDRKGIQDYDVDVYPVLVTWKRLYPSLWKRVLAKMGKYLIDKFKWFSRISNKMSILHFIFPFKRRIYINNHEDKLKEDWYNYNVVEQPDGDDFPLYQDYWEDSEGERECLDYIKWYYVWLEQNPPEPVYEAILIVPYKYLQINTYIQPIRAVERIYLNYAINKDGDNIYFN